MARQAFAVLCLSVLIYSSYGYSEDFVARYKTGLERFVKTGVKTADFHDTVKYTNFKNTLRPYATPDTYDFLTCFTCRTVVQDVIDQRRSGVDIDTIANGIVDMCVSLGIESQEICEGIINLNKYSMIYIIDNKPDLTGGSVCSIVFQDADCTSDSYVEWSVDIPDKTIETPETGISDLPPIKILHLSDIHFDPAYEVGRLAACDAPVCCRNDLPLAENPEEAAGPWGDYRNCDSPWEAVDASLDQAAAHADIDYVYFTGDIISHRVWTTSAESNNAEMTQVLDAIASKFTVPVFPILGNHEPNPVNVWTDSTDPTISAQWLFDSLAEQWTQWLPEESKPTILRGGYYTALAKPGLRVIGLNSNVCYTYNWWLFYDPIDQYGQLNWLVEVLTQAELNGEKVHILSHIPTGSSSCYKIWSREFKRIIQRFSGTITAMFNGHTHNDELQIFYDETATQPLVVAYNGGSITPYSDINPNYKVYEVDAESSEILNYDSYIYNITEANLTPDQRPVWYKLYNFKEAYPVERMTPQNMDYLVFNMTVDPVLMDQYYRFYVKEGDTSLVSGCDSACSLDLLCSIVSNEFGDTRKCDEITAVFNGN